MGLFSKKKGDAPCCCGGACGSAPKEGSVRSSGIAVLGSGCAKCNELEEAVRGALEELGLDQTVDHVTDFVEIASYGVMTTPALVVDGQVVSSGRVLSREEAKSLIAKVRGGK